MRRKLVRISRGALSGAFFLAYGLSALPFALVLPLPFVTPKLGRTIVRLFYVLFVATARWTGLYRVLVSPSDKAALSSLKGCVVAMNHISLIDICIILAHLPDSVCIAKSSAKRNPFLSAVVKKLFIANDLGADAALAEGRRLLDQGVNVVVFPQGTRGGKKLFRGAARLSLSSRKDIAVVRIDYDPVVLAKGQPWHDVGDRTITISLECRGTIRPEAPDGHREAVETTNRIASALWA